MNPPVKTSLCPKYPISGANAGQKWPLDRLTDDDIDLALSYMLRQVGDNLFIPTSNYGRRIAVSTFLAYEQIQPVPQTAPVPTHFKPGQPR